ncbi:hypothetical protein MX659_03695 [Coriobacteriia bacterium Es71-Z0120]|uniref:hypothetical protein n=1 Tax=Parvivirga hydrogeniphila TaxID=2939460 RepID=UPI002260FFB5|nr:hypothetical protein [Parvivirga hydrogeniphila]MCL4078705.1 hypothetical protein [Parvivirga hydrogeniphila]
MAKTKTTIYLDEDVLRSARIYAARLGKRDYEVVEEALREYLGVSALENAWRSADMAPDEALALAVAETHAERRAKR